MGLIPGRWPWAFAQAAAVPALMVADYYLTLWSRVVLDKEYLKRFQVEEFELNPQWRDDVGRLRWFNPRHLGLALLMWAATGFLLAVLQRAPDEAPWWRFLLGALVTPFALVVARHLANLAAGLRLIAHPEEVRGAVQVDLPHLMATSRHQAAAALLPLALTALWVRDPFLWGGLAGGLSLVAAHYRWARKGAAVKPPGGPPPAA